MKLIKISLCILILSSLIANIHSSELSSSYKACAFDDFDPMAGTCANLFNDEYMDDMIDSNDPISADSSLYRIPPETIITLLKDLGALQILQEPFYLFTNSINSRDIIDYPDFEPRPCKQDEDRMLVWHIFYNQTSHGYLTGHSTDMNKYLALEQDTLLEKLENSLEKIIGLGFNNSFNVAETLALFAHTKVQERRAGFMFQSLTKWDRINLRIALPFYYRQRNFFLTNVERRAIEQQFGASTPEEQREFQDNHLISDTLGFGDTRLELDFKLFQSAPNVRLGVELTIPTAFAVKKGLKGTHFPKPSGQPTFDFDQLYDLIGNITDPTAQQEVLTILREFSLCALDRLSANLLDTQLGNGNHFGIGALLRTKTPLALFLKWPWADKVCFNNRTSIQYLFPSTERRFYIKNPSNFSVRNFDDAEQAINNLTFLEQELVDRIYPIALDTGIQNGLQFRATSQFCFSHCGWSFIVGTDWWVQGKERFSNPKGTPEQLQQINRRKAQTRFAYQNKIMGSIVYTLERPEHDWHFSIVGDATTINAGIGKDFTVAVSIETSF